MSTSNGLLDVRLLRFEMTGEDQTRGLPNLRLEGACAAQRSRRRQGWWSGWMGW